MRNTATASLPAESNSGIAKWAGVRR